MKHVEHIGYFTFWFPGSKKISKKNENFLFQICTNATIMMNKIPQRIGEVSTFISKGQSMRS